MEIYKQARSISSKAWELYERFDKETKIIIGEQWIRAIDSIGANIAEGFGRYHYLDKNKFNYNARGSLLESIHWTSLLNERDTIQLQERDLLLRELDDLLHRLNAYIKVTKMQQKK